MASLRSLPFQIVMTLRVAAVVVALSVAFLWFVLGRVQQRVEQSGRDNFELLASAAFGGLDALMASDLRYLETLARLLPSVPDLYAAPATRALAQSFLEQRGPSALMIGQSSDEMLYLLKQDSEAPTGSSYTSGHLRPQGDGTQLITASYHAADHSTIGERHIPIDFLPTQRRWYLGAMRSPAGYVTEPYPMPGRGALVLTTSLRSAIGVVALTTPLELVDGLLERLSISANGAALLLDDQHRVVAFRLHGPRWRDLAGHDIRMQPVEQIGDPVLLQAAHTTLQLAADEPSLVTLSGEPFLLAWHNMTRLQGTRYRMLLLAPLSDMAEALEGARRDVWLTSLLGLALMLPLSWFGAGSIARVLGRLVEDSQRIGKLDFQPVDSPIHSRVREVQALGLAHASMRSALATRTVALEKVSRHLERLIGIGIHLAEQHNRPTLLNAVLDAAREFTGAQMAILFLCDADNDRLLCPVASLGLLDHERLPPLDLDSETMRRESLAVRTVLGASTRIVDDFADTSREELAYLRRMSLLLSAAPQTAVSVPLRTPDQRIIGVMHVINATDAEAGRIDRFSPSQVTYLEALAAQAAVALENQKLIASQTQLLDTLVRTLGDAIDAKSEYTGRHCARVPELAMMLAREAHAARSGPLADFGFHSEDEWREFRTGAWLHDCGKITSPEHVMDKATKLETVYNRIHEIRTRFEVLLRDARIETLEAQLSGRCDPAEAAVRYTECRQSLQDDYAFIAGCNIGGEKMADADIERVRAIGARRWLRHFDKRLGSSYEELQRHGTSDAEVLPTVEALLSDQPWHLVPRSVEQRRSLTEGFRMKVPEYLYNHGELYNLCIARGTLNAEERFKINEHIIHTIRMLEGAKFPPQLRRVPEYAGTHHETLSGSGYPRGLTAAELSIPARIMAIADIFEALTAADRPYKAPKPLSEAIQILHGMKRRGHIDPDLFDLFLSKGLHLRYAQRFLSAEQNDLPDITPYLN